MNLLLPNDVRPLHNVIWNLFLAVLPVVLAFFAARQIRRNIESGRRPISAVVVILLIVWAGFLPNTCYLLTEWRHFFKDVVQGGFYPQVRYSHKTDLRLLIATTFYIFYSGSGLVAFFLSVWPFDRILRERSPRAAAIIKIVIFAVCALGVYLGLIYRYNTWDLVKPSMLPSILQTVAVIVGRRFVVSLIVGFTVVLSLLYVAFDIWMDGLSMRLARRNAASEP